MKNIFLQIPELHPSHPGLVLVTVTGADGSTPQKPGSSALFDCNGLLSGTVGGGVVEGRTQEIAAKSGLTKKSGWLSCRLDNDISKKESAICGGKITLLIDGDPVKHLPVFREIRESISERVPGVLVTLVKGSGTDNIVIERYWTTMKKKPSIPAEIREKISHETEAILSTPGEKELKKIDLSSPGKEPMLVLLEPVLPQKNLVIAGAGHIGKALSSLGRMLDFEVTVIDDRKEYANIDNLPDADHLIINDIGSAMQGIEKTDDTFIVIVTRGHNDDAKALQHCIGSGAAYIGMIGSKVKIAKMKDEFIRNKWADEDQWQRIYAPVGLEIKSKSVAEIAVSIAAELVLVRNGGN